MDASCLTLTIDNDTFNNAPDFDASTLPAQGQAAPGWDSSISSYWANPGAGTGGTETLATSTASTGDTGLATNTPTAGDSSATAMPNETATSTSGGTGSGTGTGNSQGQGAMQMQGVMLATDILGATVTVSPQGNDQGTGTGAETSTPEAGVVSTDTPSASGDTTGTATPESSTGTGTGTDDFSTGTVEDMIVEPQTGDMQYLVVSFGTEDRWFPIPVGFLRWDSTTNGFVLMVNQNALQNAPAFTSDQFPDTSSSGWDQEFSTFWQSNGGMGGGTGSGTGSGGVTVATATATP
jgi:hypothetical protein